MANTKLPPPLLEGTIPAFFGNAITVPFQMNRAVGGMDYSSFQLKIKTIQSSRYLGAIPYTVRAGESIDGSSALTFTIPSGIADALNVGQYYKVQLAYIDAQNTPGYFSTVATVKYTTCPTVSINNLSETSLNNHLYTYTGVYSQKNKDSSEKVYSYRFDIYNANDQLIKTSGELLHDSSKDTELYESTDTFTIDADLVDNDIYYIRYTIKTINKLTVSSAKYKITQKKSIAPSLTASVFPTLDYENGCVHIKMLGGNNEFGTEKAVTGAFRILRASNVNNYMSWEEMTRFILFGQKPSQETWTDYTIEQGVTYKYALQQYNDYGLLSSRIESAPIQADFEHAYLYDGERQLKIKYNPKVTSFKNTLLESKLDTIGSKHPFIFRNGNVNYKEFPISGLISYWSDEDYLFVKSSQLKNQEKNTSLTTDNILDERTFKLEVLEWLTNGKPKLFRSPNEGNYIVRLLNVSLSPTDSVGRMLHTFSCTAYEIAAFDHDGLVGYDLLNGSEPNQKQMRWETIEFAKDGLAESNKGNLLSYPAVSLHFEGMMPGDRVYINDGIARPNTGYDTGYVITIGATGVYNIGEREGISISQVSFLDGMDNVNAWHGIVQHMGSLTYGYYSKLTNYFDTIMSVAYEDVPLRQFIGEHDVLKELTDIRTDMQNCYYLRLLAREVQNTYQTPNGVDTYLEWQNHVREIERVEQLNIYIEDLKKKKNLISQEGFKPALIQAHNALILAIDSLYPGQFQIVTYDNGFADMPPISNVYTFAENEGYRLKIDKKQEFIQQTNNLGDALIKQFLIPSTSYSYDKNNGMLLINQETLDEHYDFAYSYFSDANLQHPIIPDDYTIYKINNAKETENTYLDGHTMVRHETYVPIAIINDKKMDMDLTETREYSIKAPETLNNLKIGNGVICEIAYQQQIITYAMEVDKPNNPQRDSEVVNAKKAYESAQEALLSAIYTSNNTTEEIEAAQLNCDIKYKQFLDVLEIKIKEKEVQQGEVLP